jgi:hypothetical protein
MKSKLALGMILWTVASSTPAADADARPPIAASTGTGEHVVLYPNGRWEFVDVRKQVEAKKIADQYPENQGCPAGWQGGLIPGSRCIPPGDKDYNRGSLGRR